MVKLNYEKKKEETEEEDDYDFDEPNCLFKLIAHMLSNIMTFKKMSITEAVSFFDEGKKEPADKLKQVIKLKFDKLDDAEGIWSSIESEIGHEHAELILPLLKDAGK